MKKKPLASKVFVSVIILCTVVFLSPLLIGAFSGSSIPNLFSDNSNGFSTSLKRTISFALLSAMVTVLVGFCLALLLSNISLNSKFGSQLSFFIFPVTLGNVAAVFVFKVLLFNTNVFNGIVRNGNNAQTLFLIALQFWQFGFLFAYLFWLNIQNTSKGIRDYSIGAGLSRFERIRDITLPQARNLFILFLFIAFIFSYYEDINSQLIFRASQGTRTEFINHWLNRTYQSDLLINPDYANQAIFKTGIVIFAIGVSLFLILGPLILLSFGLLKKIKISSQNKPLKHPGRLAFVIAAISMAIILAPVLFALLKSEYHFSEDIFSIVFPFALTLVAAFVATILAILLGIASRLAFIKLLSGFNRKSLVYFLAIFLLQVIPPLCIVLCCFKWMTWIGYNSELLVYIVWIMGHCILTLPLLGSFILATHFLIKENELNYLAAYGISRASIIKFSFMKRFKAEYILTLLFAFTFIWNDSGVNMVLSDNVPSFSANLKMLFIGRAADYSKATNFVLVALALSLACVFVWQYIVRKSTKTR